MARVAAVAAAAALDGEHGPSRTPPRRRSPAGRSARGGAAARAVQAWERVRGGAGAGTGCGGGGRGSGRGGGDIFACSSAWRH
eukprot:scaffold125825_cov51-Phaeocystis_antarctica.AAC.1